jgi:predicted acyltransferase
MSNETAVNLNETVASERLRQFQDEVSQLRVTGGRANPERQGLVAGIVAWVVAVVLEFVAYFTSHGTDSALEQRDMIILAIFGVVLAVIGTGLVVRFAITRYLRYWLVRLIYEDREQTDRIVAALERRQ